MADDSLLGFTRRVDLSDEKSVLVPVAAEFHDKDLAQGANAEVTAGAFIGRYRIERQLGRGGFGVVYLARDGELDRLVAIKLPHRQRVQNDDDRLMYLTEARTLAQLDHPSIVPVYDFGVVPDGRCFVVSKYIDGQDLSVLMGFERLAIPRVATLLATVAEALHYVHEAKLIHRDIKPSNLLVGTDGRVYVADFGLAMRETSQVDQLGLVGTLNYMSPEQARGEGHRIDGRSDQFSLGCVMYELLIGSRPFVGATTSETLSRLLTADPKPPRELNSAVPRELNRICLKLLSKIASQRYVKTRELADDLRHWLASPEAAQLGAGPVRTAPRELANEAPSAAQLAVETPHFKSIDPTVTFQRAKSSASIHATIVPRGLRAFTREDADFFWSLLPGTRDRDGLPTSLNHWRQWISHPSDESAESHRVGVISGPTGCGKSSFVRAGVLPILDASVLSVLVEASVDLTERQLAAGIARRCSTPLDGSLPETLAAIRRGHGLDASQSLLIVIDQFEQWLHAHPEPQDTELVRAIRQCDGQRLRCLILVRDDFWLALNRFMDVVEAPVMLGRNAQMLDLFDLRHAKKVLIEFGRAFGRLPLEPEPPSREQDRFLDEALSNLATEGKVIPVRLTLFAEMVKSREWHPETLRQMGGAVGIGEQFLAESFTVTYAPANQRRHEPAARRVLQSLLPDIGTEIKASRRPRAELLTIAGYGDDRSQFDELMAILESDLKIITATESIERLSTSGSSILSGSSSHSVEQTAYQLSHDFLVPSIRDWLSSRQRETFRGRLQERLREQAALWSRQREARFLPNMLEWLAVRCFIPNRSMTPAERTMLAAKDRVAVTTLAAIVFVVVALSLGFREYRRRLDAHSLVSQLRVAGPANARAISDQLAPYQRTADAELSAAISDAEPGSPSWFALQVAQLLWHPEQAEEVFERYLDAPAETVPMIVESLSPFADQLKPRCWALLETDRPNDGSTEAKGFRAAQLLAKIDPGMAAGESADRWRTAADFIAQHLVRNCIEHPDHYAQLADSFVPVTSHLIGPLAKCLGAVEDIDSRIRLSLLTKYLGDNLTLRTRLSLDTAPWQRAAILPATSELVSFELWDVIRNRFDESAAAYANRSSDERIMNSRRVAMSAALLLTQTDSVDVDELWPLLKRSPIPNVRTQLIHHFHVVNVPPNRLIARLRLEGDPGISSALLMALGAYSPDNPALTEALKTFVRDQFRNDPDAGVHSAAEWLLRRWNVLTDQDVASLTQTDKRPAEPRPPQQWTQNSEGHTFVLVRASDKLPRDLLVATKEVTATQYQRFKPNNYYDADFAPTPDCPFNSVTWGQAVAYCNWLSKQDGIPEDQWCYPRDETQLETWIPDPEIVHRTGYRLPTDAEWQLACFAGTQSRTAFGEDLQWMTEYAWFFENTKHIDSKTKQPTPRSRPVGSKLPNDWGLFDFYGNVSEWCNDVGEFHSNERMLGGYAAGAAADMLADIRKGSFVTTVVYKSMGFRVVRTLKGR